MTHGFEQLSEKEKETLRLILFGHDAKSMAGKLDLSVHTVNERLRNARRKLGVTSSKEAARILFDEEGETPDFLVHKQMGDEGEPFGDQKSGASGRAIPAWLVVTGVTVMIAMLAAFAMLAPGYAGEKPNTITIETQESEAQAAARQWLELLDADDWAASYALTASSFREANTLEMWTGASTRVRSEFGAFQSRQLLGEDDVPSPQGYRVVRFRAQYGNRSNVQETVSLVREDGMWKVAGVYVS